MRVNDIVSKKSIESIFEDLDPKSELYVDMDGVLADFFGVWNQMMGVKHWKEIKDTDAALQKIKDTKDFWINLPMTRNGKSLLNAIKRFKGKYNILSAPLPGDPNSEPQKREWIQKHLSMFPPSKIIIDHDKAKYAKQADGTPNALIDDFGQNINKWENAGGVGIQHKDIQVGNTISRLAKALDTKEDPVEENFADRQMAMLQKQDNYLEKMWKKDILEKYGKTLDEFYKIRKALDGKVVKIDGEEVELEFEMDTVAGFVDVWDNNSGKDVNPFTLKFMEITENFADGKKKGKSRPGRVKRSGASCNGSVTELRAKAKKASGEKAKMYHWCANMKSGKKK